MFCFVFQNRLDGRDPWNMSELFIMKKLLRFFLLFTRLSAHDPFIYLFYSIPTYSSPIKSKLYVYSCIYSSIRRKKTSNPNE